MTDRLVQCMKLKKELPGMDTPPYPGEIGERIFQHISAQAWDDWLGHQTMLINEYRLSLINPEAREFLKTEMERFLFTGEATKPPGFTEAEKKTD